MSFDSNSQQRDETVVDELRTQVWDLLFRTKESKSIDEISEVLSQETQAIRAVVDHEWFLITDDSVSISHKE